jgi:hypothetical protein
MQGDEPSPSGAGIDLVIDALPHLLHDQAAIDHRIDAS